VRRLVKNLAPLVALLLGCFPLQRGQVRPAWIDHLPQKPGWIFALGYSPPYINPADAWQAAAQRGREELARTLQLTIQGGQWWYGFQQGRSLQEELSRESLNIVKVVGSQVLERYHDPIEGMYYVLVGMCTDLALQQLRQRWLKALQDLTRGMDPGQKQNVQERAEKAFQQLEKSFR